MSGKGDAKKLTFQNLEIISNNHQNLEKPKNFHLCNNI